MPTPMKPWSPSDEPKSVSDKHLRAHLREVEREGPRAGTTMAAQDAIDEAGLYERAVIANRRRGAPEVDAGVVDAHPEVPTAYERLMMIQNVKAGKPERTGLLPLPREPEVTPEPKVTDSVVTPTKVTPVKQITVTRPVDVKFPLTNAQKQAAYRARKKGG